MRVQVVYMQVLEPSKLFRRKTLNSTKVKELQLPSFDICVGANKSWSYHKKTKLQIRYDWCQWYRWYWNDSRSSWALLVGLRVWDEWLEPEGKNLCRKLSSSKSLRRYTWRKLWWGLNLMYRVWGPLFEEVPKGIWIPMPKRKRGKAFLQEQEPSVITTEFKIV